MELPIDVSRCSGRRSQDPGAERCPVRLECARYVQRFDDVSRGINGVQYGADHHWWLCQSDAYEMRIEP
jgi:hypothetical protein